MKLWLAGAAAVCQMVSEGGTRYGNDEITSPRKPSMNSTMVAANGAVSCSMRNAIQPIKAVSPVSSGTGQR